jgi:hypothetical protein
VWKKTVDVQEHFNDLELRIRNTAIALIGAILTVGALAIKERMVVQVAGIIAPVAAIIVFIDLVVWIAFYLMDRFWYHRLPKGAVGHCEDLETSLEGEVGGISLTKRISAESPHVLFGKLRLHKERKMDCFYAIVATALIPLLVVLFVIAPPASPEGPSSDVGAAQQMVSPEPSWLSTGRVAAPPYSHSMVAGGLEDTS